MKIFSAKVKKSYIYIFFYPLYLIKYKLYQRYVITFLPVTKYYLIPYNYVTCLTRNALIKIFIDVLGPYKICNMPQFTIARIWSSNRNGHRCISHSTWPFEVFVYDRLVFTIHQRVNGYMLKGIYSVIHAIILWLEF